MNADRLLVGAKTAWQLGAWNVLSVLFYRLQCRTGTLTVRPNVVATGDLYAASPGGGSPTPPAVSSLRCFGWKALDGPTLQPPDWFRDPITLRQFPEPARQWNELSDFDERFGDIKCIWELSRWDWMLPFAQRYRHAGDASALATLNEWLHDWLKRNPPYLGPNWKCGQETSIRVMHAAMAALILDQVTNPAQGLIDLVRVHLRRIEPTLSYAMAQDNNHGTSEAAALFIGGSWLATLRQRDGMRWESLGRQWLENRIARLIDEDGGFSQYSVNYHRVLLDTISMVEVWRRRMVLAEFSPRWRVRTEAAARWLHAMVDPATGDAPNVGANDGARLLPLTDADHRDYRPSVQLSMALFAGLAAYPPQGSWNWPLQWLGIETPRDAAPGPQGRQFDDGGFAVLRRGPAMALMRFPRFRFRPSHADALHVDLWKDGANLLRDGGTYSYNTDARWLRYFSGTASHNTVQFDDRDQMPRLGRFLFGDWLATEGLETLREEGDAATFAAGYRDRQGACHHRRATLRDSGLTVQDRIEGSFGKAVLRWRLAPGAWRLEGATATNGEHKLSIEATMPIRRLELVSGWESRYYMQKTEVPVIEVEVGEPGMLTSQYHWS